MKVMLDTSTLVAGMLTDHVHYPAAHLWLARATAGAFDYLVSSHSVAEVYSVLTRIPRRPRISSSDAWRMVRDNITAHAHLVSIGGSEYASLVEELAQRNLGGGLVYDAIIAKAAEISQVDRLVTLNDAHFLRVWPGGAGRIVSTLIGPTP